MFTESQSISVYEQYYLLSVTVHQCIWAVLSTVSHSPSMYVSSIIYCQTLFINIYELYYLLSVTVHQCIWAVISTLSQCSSVYMSSIIYCQSQFINVCEQYYLLSDTVHQYIWAVLFTVSHSSSTYIHEQYYLLSSMHMSSIIYCRSQFINVYEQYYLLSVTIHQWIWAVLSYVSHVVHQVYEHYCLVWAPWLRGRASDSRLRGPGFESCAAVLKPWASFFTLHCSSPLSCINEYLAIDKWWICVRAAFAH